MNISLRDYQKKQLKFLQNKIPQSTMIGLQSPTGSGKTYVILTYIKQYMQDHPNRTVIFSTGFNKLVFDVAELASSTIFDLHPMILMGSAHFNCVHRNNVPFTRIDYPCNANCYNVDDPDKDKCKDTKIKQCKYMKTLSEGGHLIITNHSTLIIQGEQIKPDLCIIDEAHTYVTFFDEAHKYILTSKMLKRFDNALETLKLRGDILQANLIKRNLQENRSVPENLQDKILSQLPIKNRHEYIKFMSQHDYQHDYIKMNDNNFYLTEFYMWITPNIPHCSFVLMSATLDRFTCLRFNISMKNIYKETKQIIDYSKSNFVIVTLHNHQTIIDKLIQFLNFEITQKHTSGLFLSTTLADVKTITKRKKLCGYKIFKDVKDFTHYDGMKLLCASRKLFQGVNIPDLKFICLNKIPFPNYGSEEEQKREQFFISTIQNYWINYTIPLTENSIIQSTGRLWRKTTDSGDITILDIRLANFTQIINDAILNIRKGIVQIQI